MIVGVINILTSFIRILLLCSPNRIQWIPFNNDFIAEVSQLENIVSAIDKGRREYRRLTLNVACYEGHGSRALKGQQPFYGAFVDIRIEETALE